MSVVENDRRSRQRKELDMEVLVSLLPEGSGYRHVKLIDLGFDGIGIRRTADAFDEGNEVIILIPDPLESAVLREVRSTVVFADDERVGLQFNSFTAQSMSAVMALMASGGDE